MDFRSDNVAGAAPQIMAALNKANTGSAPAYGADDWSQRLDEAFSALFEKACRVFAVSTGTGANSLALAALSPPHGAIYCHTDSHIVVDECNAPEFFTGGAKLIDLPGANGKIDPAALQAALGQGWRGVQHHPQPAAISITQATEAGTVYKPNEIGAIAALGHAHGLRLHMDGARFANAVAALNVTPADLSWKAGVDVLSFGATKNGALAAEAVVFFDPDLADGFLFRRKRGGHLFSKMRFLSAQLLAMVDDNLWLDLARHANAQARALSDGLAKLPGVSLAHPVEANEVFAVLPPKMAQALIAKGFRFYPWSGAEGAAGTLYRFVCAFDTKPESVAAFLETARQSL